jgi:hypothetical protein
LLVAFGEAVRQVGYPAACGQLGGPDDVAEDHIEVLPAGLELGPELVQALPGVRVAFAKDDPVLSLVLLVEVADKFGDGTRLVRRGGKVKLGRSTALLAPAAAPRSTAPARPVPLVFKKFLRESPWAWIFPHAPPFSKPRPPEATRSAGFVCTSFR